MHGIPNEQALEDATQTFDELELVVARVETSAGVTGVGFTYTIGRGGRAVKQFLDDVLVPRLEGMPVAPRRVHADLLLDANCSFGVAEARRFVDRLDVPVDWLEEPLEKGDYAAYADLRGKVDVPIALGENAYNATQFKQVLERGATDVLQPDVCRGGGVTPWLTVAGAASLWNTPVSSHYVEPVHVHLVAPFDDVPYVEHHSTVLNEVVESPLERRGGGFTPPDAPGHGMVFDGLDRYAK